MLKPGVIVRGVCCCANAYTKNRKTDAGGDEKTPGGGTTALDDGDVGGIGLGMEVWDDYERELKVCEAAEAAQEANATD